MRLDLILDHQSLSLVINLLRELSRNGVVGSDVLDDETLVALNAGKDSRLFNRPTANIRPVLFRLRVLLLGVRRDPS